MIREQGAGIAKQAKNSRALRWTIGLGLTSMVAVGLVLLFLLTQATTNRDLYERNYSVLFAVNVVVASMLLLVIAWIAFRLNKRLRQKKFGSRLLVKLAAVFALAGFAPGVLIYVVSYQFVSRSIESWFDVKVEGALEAGLNLGRTTLEALSADLADKTRSAAIQLSDTPAASAALPLERARDAMRADDLMLWGASGRLIAAAGQSRYQLSPELPTQQQLRTARAQRGITWIDGLDDAVAGETTVARIKALVLINSTGVGALAEPRYLDVYKRQGQSGTAAIDAVPASMRPGVQALSFQVLRFLGRAQALRKLLAPRTPPPAADALLCVCLLYTSRCV